MIVVHAKQVLRMIAYDINQQLDNDVSTETIYNSVSKRLEQLIDNKYRRVDWS